MQDIIERNREQIVELCRTHHVRTLSVFGSAVRDDFDPERSDVDLLVEFELLDPAAYVEIKEAFEEALVRLLTRPVDLIRAGSINNPYLLREIDADRTLLYAA